MVAELQRENGAMSGRSRAVESATVREVELEAERLDQIREVEFEDFARGRRQSLPSY